VNTTKQSEFAAKIRLTEGVSKEILVDPTLDEVRQLPQFQVFLQRAGLANAPAP